MMRRTSLPLCALLLLVDCAAGHQETPDSTATDRSTPLDFQRDIARDLATPADQSQDSGQMDNRAKDSGPDSRGIDGPPSPDLQPDSRRDLALEMGTGTLVAPFTLDFEQSNGGLSGNRDWQWGELGSWVGANCDGGNEPPDAAHSGNKLWGTILNGCYTPRNNARSNCSNKDLSDDSVLELKVTIPSNWTVATMSYWQWLDIFTPFDWAEVRVDGQVVGQICLLGAQGEWSEERIDLRDFIGQTVTITFHFMASNSVNRSGWYLDDLAIQGS